MDRIVFLDRATLAPQIRVRRPAFVHVWTKQERTAPDQVAVRPAGANIAITNKAPSPPPC
jgi:glycerate dehydrogenase